MEARRAHLQGKGTQFFQDGTNKPVYRWDKCPMYRAIMWKSDFSVDYNPERVM
jgi:hypothetical protein